MAKDRGSILSDTYDVVVIGSGLAGLTAANLLGRAGFKVLVLEQHYKLGGLAAWFRRPDRRTFDVSLHGFPVGMIKSCRRYWNSQIASRIVRLPDLRFHNPNFRLQTSFDRQDFTRLLIEHFGIASERVEKFFETARAMNYYDDQGQTIGEFLEQFFPGRDDIVRFVLEPITFANGSTLEDPAVAYAIVFSNFMSKGVYTFSGGTDLLIDLMKEELRKNGVRWLVRCPARRIEVENGKAVAVRVDGAVVRCRAVVSNAHVLTTVFDLLDEDCLSPDFREQARQVRPNNSSTQVYLALKPNCALDRKQCGDLLFSSTADRFSRDLLLAPQVTSRTYSFYYPGLRAGDNRCYIVASANARYDDWANLPEHEYQKRKDQLVEDTLDDLERFVPEIRKRIDWAECATPVTFRRYTGHPQGASFGTKFEGLAISRALPQQVRGLFHTGSVGIIMSGWLGAVNYGAIVANEVEMYLVENS